MYGDLTCAIHTVNNFLCFVIIKRMHVFVSEDYMLDWKICYPLEIKLLLLLLLLQSIESQLTSLKVFIKFEAGPTGVQLKGAAKLLSVPALTTAVCRITFMLYPVRGNSNQSEKAFASFVWPCYLKNNIFFSQPRLLSIIYWTIKITHHFSTAFNIALTLKILCSKWLIQSRLNFCCHFTMIVICKWQIG